MIQGGEEMLPFSESARYEMVLPSQVIEEVRTRITLLAGESTEARVALAGVVIDGLYTFAVTTAGCLGAGSCRKHSP
jgi:hypothetical protein